MKELAEIAKDGLTRLMPEFSRLSELVPKPGPNDSELKSFLLTAAGAALSTLGAISGIGAAACQFAIWGCDFIVLCADKFYDLFNGEATPGRGSESLESVEFYSDAEMGIPADSGSSGARMQGMATAQAVTFQKVIALCTYENGSASVTASSPLYPGNGNRWDWKIYDGGSGFSVQYPASSKVTAQVTAGQEGIAFIMARVMKAEKIVDSGGLIAFVIKRPVRPFTVTARSYTNTALAINIGKCFAAQDIRLADGETVTVRGGLRLGGDENLLSDNYYFIEKDRKYTLLPWDKVKHENDLLCMAATTYGEAGKKNQYEEFVWLGYTIVNRLGHPRFNSPSSIMEVLEGAWASNGLTKDGGYNAYVRRDRSDHPGFYNAYRYYTNVQGYTGNASIRNCLRAAIDVYYGFRSDPGILQESPNAKLTDNRGKDSSGNSSRPSGSSGCGTSSYHYLPIKKSNPNWDNDYYWILNCCGTCGNHSTANCNCSYCKTGIGNP